MSDSELLAQLLQNGLTSRKALETAQRLMAEAGTLTHLAAWPVTQIREVDGVGPVKVRPLKAVVEIGQADDGGAGLGADRAESAGADLRVHASEGDGTRGGEVLGAVPERKNRLINAVEVTSGTATSSLAHPREVFRSAIQHAAAGIVCVHNHPSGDPSPERGGGAGHAAITGRIAGRDIELLDHLIVGEARMDPRALGYYSFREAGVI